MHLDGLHHSRMVPLPQLGAALHVRQHQRQRLALLCICTELMSDAAHGDGTDNRHALAALVLGLPGVAGYGCCSGPDIVEAAKQVLQQEQPLLARNCSRIHLCSCSMTLLPCGSPRTCLCLPCGEQCFGMNPMIWPACRPGSSSHGMHTWRTLDLGVGGSADAVLVAPVQAHGDAQQPQHDQPQHAGRHNGCQVGLLVGLAGQQP